MNKITKFIYPIILATCWISISEFIRNEFLLKDLWVNHYQQMGSSFPDKAINGAIWGVWSLAFALIIYILLKKFNYWQTFIFAWFVGFVMMWLVVANLGVLPMNILVYAIPLSILETMVAALILKKMS